MQTFNQIKKQKMARKWLSIYILLLILSFFVIYINQSSINAYWNQTYHKMSPLEPLNQYTWWQKGDEFQQNLVNFKKNITSFFDEPELIEPKHPKQQDVIAENEKKLNHNEQEQVRQDTCIPSTDTQRTAPKVADFVYEDPNTHKMMVKLKTGDKVFFAGDSLMQGVAPKVQQKLSKEYKIESINLSKQSTGLSYPSFFDWPKTIKKTLEDHPDVRLLVMFLGPNDPWDFPDPNHRGTYLKFKSSDWENVYRQRIQNILDTAKEHNVAVIWLGPPYMKAKKLNGQMDYLRSLYQSSLDKKVIWLPTEKLLSNGKNQYQDSIKINDKMSKVRSKDGIHFSDSGQQILSDYINQHINFTATN